jgi:ribonuclease P protein component
MIKKKYRLKECDVRKVLKWNKPFFSYWLIANMKKNFLGYSRFCIALSTKNTKTSINRNFFRRRFYDISRNYILKWWYDFVFIPKKWKTFDQKNWTQITDFDKDINFILKNTLKP